MKRIETDLWNPSPENPRMVKYAGQRSAQEVFEELQHRLESTGYLPDEYFLLSSEWENGKEIPRDSDIFCTTDFGGSEGIYLDIYLKWYDDQQKKSTTTKFATGKTLGESDLDLDRMFLIASAVTKAFHSDGVHARYVRLGEAENTENAVIHLSGDEQRLIIDSLVDRRNQLKGETQAVEQLLRRVTGSITELINEIGERPMMIGDFDKAVLAIHDGDIPAFSSAYPKAQEKTGELLVHTAGRPGNVGKKMTMLLLADAKDIPNDIYLEACKKAIATGDTDRVLLMAEQAEACVGALDMSLYGEMINESLYKHRSHIARALLKQCSSDQIKAADPGLLPQVLRQDDYSMASSLVEKGIDGNKCAADVIFALTYRGNNRSHFKYLLERGMDVSNVNYAAMQACVKTNSVETARLLLDRGMDFDLYAEWESKQSQVDTSGEVFSTIKELWENEIKQPELNHEQEPEQHSGITMSGM